jgi:uncharacterized protein YndB with AHSA1/START domain
MVSQPFTGFEACCYGDQIYFFLPSGKLNFMGIIQQLEIKASINILKPIAEVFESIVDPQKMSGYFLASGSGRIETGKTLIWKFPEFDMEFPVKIKKVESPTYCSFYWDDIDGKEMLVEITLQAMGNDRTFVIVTEKSRDNDEKGIDWLKRNTEGWANFLACLKAYLEYDINLRKGAFDISQMPEFQGKE